MLGFGQAIMGTAEPPVVATDVFAPTTYTGNAATRTITTAIDLTGAASPPYGTGGLVWIKGRSGSTGHRLFDTVRGVQKALETSSTAAETTLATSLTAFGAGGFDLGADTTVNANTATYAAWAFRKAPKFFDIATYTGTGSATTVAHNLGAVPTLMLIKNRTGGDAWSIYHASLGNTQALAFTSATPVASSTYWNNTTPTSSVLTVGTAATVNSAAATYVGYLFGDVPGVCAAGSYAGSGSDVTVSCGFAPRFVMVRRTSATGSWYMLDTARGIVAGSDPDLTAESTGAEASTDRIDPVSGGFVMVGGVSGSNTAGSTYLYIAIA